MQEFLSAIQAGASVTISRPSSYPSPIGPPSSVGTRWACSTGLASEDKDPRKSLHVGEVAVPELAPDEAYVAVMASAINFNTVWTSIFEPFRPSASSTGWARRACGASGMPSTTTSSVPTPPGWCCGRVQPCALEAGGQGHRALQLRGRPEPERARRFDAGRQPAHLGLRDELRWPGRPGRGEGQPAHAQAQAPHLGGVGRQRPVQLDVLPDAGFAATAPTCSRATRCWCGERPVGWGPTPCSTC